MDVSWWWRAFLMTCDLNHNRKCCKSLTLKASCIRNLFHQDEQWRENSITMFWGDWGKTLGANAETSGATTPRSWIMTTLWLTRCLLRSSFWLLRIQQSSPPTIPTHRSSTPVIFPIPEDEITTQRAIFWRCWRDPQWISERDEDPDAKWLPEVLLIMEIPLESCINFKGNYFKGDGANRNFIKWLSYSTWISVTFGYHHIYTLYTLPNYTQYTNNGVYTSTVLFKYKCMYIHINKCLPNVKKVCLMNRYWKN
jgi:hypothetical protein